MCKADRKQRAQTQTHTQLLSLCSFSSPINTKTHRIFSPINISFCINSNQTYDVSFSYFDLIEMKIRQRTRPTLANTHTYTHSQIRCKERENLFQMIIRDYVGFQTAIKTRDDIFCITQTVKHTQTHSHTHSEHMAHSFACFM